VAGAARAIMRPTEGGDARGTVSFEPMRNGGLMVKATMTGLTPGPHGFHVHEYGDCSAPDASSAGGHFDFLGTPTTLPADVDHITGNLGQLEAGPDGTAKIEHPVQDANLWGPASIVGRAVVVHARGNDPDSPPDGAAGPRVACGVIGIVRPDM
jgi:Cu-Zn family superoxide dismutase